MVDRPPGALRRVLGRPVFWLIVVALLLIALHRPLLRGAGGVLVVDEPWHDGRHLVVLPVVDGDRWYEVAVRWRNEHAEGTILLVEPYPNRLVEHGLLPSFVEIARERLTQRDVPVEAIVTVAGEARGSWSAASQLSQWLKDNPDARLDILAARFRSRYERHVLDQVLTGGQAERVRVHALPNSEFDESDWWRKRAAVKDVVGEHLRLAYAYLAGNGESDQPYWDVDQYEAKLRESQP
ncbi:MAG: hypothetical protein WDZ59_10265 [Pirellulales bacterium]